MLMVVVTVNHSSDAELTAVSCNSADVCPFLFLFFVPTLPLYIYLYSVPSYPLVFLLFLFPLLFLMFTRHLFDRERAEIPSTEPFYGRSPGGSKFRPGSPTYSRLNVFPSNKRCTRVKGENGRRKKGKRY